MTNISFSEEELSVEVTDLDVVVIGDVDNTVLTATDSHECECLNQFTSESTSTNHEQVEFRELLLQLLSVDLNLIVIS